MSSYDDISLDWVDDLQRFREVTSY